MAHVECIAALASFGVIVAAWLAAPSTVSAPSTARVAAGEQLAA